MIKNECVEIVSKYSYLYSEYTLEETNYTKRIPAEI